MTPSLSRSARRCPSSAVLGLVAAAVLAPCGSGMGAHPALLTDTDLQAPPHGSTDPTVTRSRPVSVDFDVLAALKPGRGLTLDLFDGVRL